MAKKISLSKGGTTGEIVSGENNGVFTIVGTKHTGRVSRNCEAVYVSGTGVGGSKTITVVQEGAAVFISADMETIVGSPIDTLSCPKDGGTVTIEGWSNSPMLKAAWKTNDRGHTSWNSQGYNTDNNGVVYPAGGAIPSVFSFGAAASGIQAPFNVDFSSDTNQNVARQGKAEQYKFIFSVNIPANPDTEEIIRQIEVQDSENHTVIYEIRQTAGNASLEVSPTSITLNSEGTALADGSEAVIRVTSNTHWTATVGN